jgi:hypothetical protein
MSNEDNFVFSGFVVLFFGWFFIFLSSGVIFDLLFLWVLFLCPRAKCEPHLRMMESAWHPYESL